MILWTANILLFYEYCSREGLNIVQLDMKGKFGNYNQITPGIEGML